MWCENKEDMCSYVFGLLIHIETERKWPKREENINDKIAEAKLFGEIW